MIIGRPLDLNISRPRLLVLHAFKVRYSLINLCLVLEFATGQACICHLITSESIRFFDSR